MLLSPDQKRNLKMETALPMKKMPRTKPTAKRRNISAAMKPLGGQPENDEDARAAGLKSATTDEPLVSPASSQTGKRRKG